MEFISTDITDVILIKPKVFRDQRGFFTETFRRSLFSEAGMTDQFVQDNMSRSVKGTLRGLHYQIEKPQAKLVMAIHGEILDVAVDVRKGSPTFGQYISCILSDANNHMLYVPKGFAHGFCVLSDEASFMYKCTDYYHPEGERGIHWNDPSIGIQWPIKKPLLSAKDEKLPFLSDVDENDLP